jgi:amino acid transporter/predicted HicB family RNase H-like nuclease
MKSNSDGKLNFTEKVTRKIFGAPRDIHDPHIFHKLSLIPLLAWIGLGADGLSSSAYGPEEAFKALGDHIYLAIFLAVATALTVSVISYAYSNIIEHFPHGGGGYIVATHMLGEKAGVVSGCALIVDYVLTISVSIASCVDALFSFLPLEFQKFKVLTAATLIILLILLNIRGLKESILVLAPIFVTFLITHILLLGYGIFSHAGQVKQVADNFQSNLSSDLSTIGFLGVLLIFLRAYSLGGGTYTGIEAVSNGLQALREPKVQFGKRTMLYMAASLALTAGGLFLCYLFIDAKPVAGKTLNAVLADNLYQGWQFGYWIALLTILSEGALLLVGAQTGFIDAPRVMANMAVDSWLPHRFASFSERLTMRNGILMIGILALAVLFYTHGSISTLVVMYSINVFITFSLSEFGMSRFYIKNRKIVPKWKRQLCIQLTGLIFCLTILSITIFEKFGQGGWLTLVITTLLILLCYIINSHYSKVKTQLKHLDEILGKMPQSGPINKAAVDKKDMTAILLVGGFNGVGIHSLFSIIRSFPGMYKNFVFISVAVIDQGAFKGKEGLEDLKKSVEESLKKYVELARRLGFPAEYRMATGTDLIEQASELTLEVSREFSKSTVFSGQLSFRLEKFYHRLLHNEAAFAIQRRLQWNGVTNVILPIRLDIAKPLVKDKKRV